MTKIEQDLQVITEAAHAGGEVLRKYFGQTLDLVEKSTAADFQTKADLESEKSILDILKAKLSTYNIQSEEDGKTDKNSDYTLVIDPLDGTNNFILGIPHFSVSIGLLYKGEGVVGVVYQPITNQTFSAIKGEGSYLNGKRIYVNKFTNPKQLTLAYTCGYKIDRKYLGAVINSLICSEHKRITYPWSAAIEYCMLASGKIESVVTDGIELHDFAAGKLIALEAGARIVDFAGKNEKDYSNSHFIASNSGEINEFIVQVIKPLQ